MSNKIKILYEKGKKVYTDSVIKSISRCLTIKNIDISEEIRFIINNLEFRTWHF